MMHHATHIGRDVGELLEAHDILPTTQRLQIAQLLFSAPQHLSADQVLKELRRTGSRVSKATVYNTLNLFAQKGLVREVVVDPSKVFYDSNAEPHHHFYNEDTGSLSDFPASAITFASLPELPEGTVADGVEVVVKLRNSNSRA
jgi:Fur family transcriptional regulator, iron response regulator